METKEKIEFTKPKKRPRTYNEAIVDSFAEALHDEYKNVFAVMFARQTVINAQQLRWLDARLKTLDKNTKILCDFLTKPQEDENDEHKRTEERTLEH